MNDQLTEAEALELLDASPGPESFWTDPAEGSVR